MLASGCVAAAAAAADATSSERLRHALCPTDAATFTQTLHFRDKKLGVCLPATPAPPPHPRRHQYNWKARTKKTFSTEIFQLTTESSAAAARFQILVCILVECWCWLQVPVDACELHSPLTTDNNKLVKARQAILFRLEKPC